MKGSMQFQVVCEAFQQIENTPSRLEMTRLLAELFAGCTATEAKLVSWFVLGSAGPRYQKTEFAFGQKLMIRAISRWYEQNSGDLDASGVKAQSELSLFEESEQSLPAVSPEVMRLSNELGDLGIAVEQLLGKTNNISQDTRSVDQIHTKLLEIIHAGGEGSQERKLQLVEELVFVGSPVTAKFLVRMILGTMRVGLSDMTVLDALSWMKTGDKSLRARLEVGYQVRADVGTIAEVLIRDGIEAVDGLDIELGVPIYPALCQRLNSASEMIEKMGEVLVEPKYDGTRVLIHIDKLGKEWKIRTFTRNLEESSGMFPELLENLDALDATTCILDCEAVGFDPETGALLPFQLTIKRKRKHNIAETASEIPVRMFVFDVLYLDGVSHLRTPLLERKKLLRSILPESSLWLEAPYIQTSDPEELRVYHASQLAEGLEGAVIKQVHSVYQPGRKGWSWVKFKEIEGRTGKLSDTIDCVVMGYLYGKGKRTQFGIGAFLVGVRGQGGQIYTIAKIGTGLTDAQWVEMFDRCEVLRADSKPDEYMVDDALRPDVWVRPELVVEIAADELTDSPVHSAGKALRFPRLVKFRDDKSVSEATTVAELESIIVD